MNPASPDILQNECERSSRSGRTFLKLFELAKTSRPRIKKKQIIKK